MTRRTLLAGVILWVALASTLSAQTGTPARDQAPPESQPSAAITGFVVDAQSGTPVPGARVRANGPGGPPSVTITDGDGRFEIRNLAAGKYSVAATRAAYIATTYGQRSPNGRGAILELVAGKTIEKIRIPISRGGVISGVVLDEYGHPAVGIRVQAWQYRYERGSRQLSPVFGSGGASVQTDDLGAFRIYGLQSGHYYVSARPHNMPQRAPMPVEMTGPIATYYPNAPDAAAAQHVAVNAGRETAGINIFLVSGRLARLRGIAVRSSGEPFVGASVLVSQHDQTGGYSASAAVVRPDGSFEITGVAAGQYVLTVRPPNARDDDDVEVGRTRITVTGEDIDGITLVGGRGAIVRGTIVTDEGIPVPLRPAQIRLQLVQAAEERAPVQPPPGVNDDYSFEWKTCSAERASMRARCPARLRRKRKPRHGP